MAVTLSPDAADYNRSLPSSCALRASKDAGCRAKQNRVGGSGKEQISCIEAQEAHKKAGHGNRRAEWGRSDLPNTSTPSIPTDKTRQGQTEPTRTRSLAEGGLVGNWLISVYARVPRSSWSTE